jgi:hypothetical protein
MWQLKASELEKLTKQQCVEQVQLSQEKIFEIADELLKIKTSIQSELVNINECLEKLDIQSCKKCKQHKFKNDCDWCDSCQVNVNTCKCGRKFCYGEEDAKSAWICDCSIFCDDCIVKECHFCEGPTIKMTSYTDKLSNRFYTR